MRWQLDSTRACGVGSNMGEHKGIGRNLSLIDLGCGPGPILLSVLHGKNSEMTNEGVMEISPAD